MPVESAEIMTGACLLNYEEDDTANKIKFGKTKGMSIKKLVALSEYNNRAVVPEHMKYTDLPTFAEMYKKWKTYRRSLKNQMSDSTWKNYKIAFNHFSNLHNRKFISIRT